MKSNTKALLVIGTIVAAGVVSALLWGPQEKKALKKLKKKAKKYKGEWASKTHKLKEKAQHVAEEAVSS
jgi:gas vesicle protein